MKYYRFQPINKLTLQNLNNQVNWVSDPYLFNDPFEFSHQSNFHLDENGKVKYVQGEELKNLEQIRERIKEYGVVCYSKDYQNNLLWSHYADNHSGMCLVFDIELENSNGLYEVNYTEQFPMIDLSDKEKIHEEILRIVTTKPKEWAYEQELRQVYIMKNMKYEYQGKLVQIIFGCRTKLDDIKMVANIARRYNPEIEISRTYPQPNTYKLATGTIPIGSTIPEYWLPNINI